MKKIIIIIFITAILFVTAVSCKTKEAEPLPSQTAPGIEIPADIINIYRPPVQSMQVFKDLDNWENAIEEIYGIKIKIHNISPLYDSKIPYGNYYPQAIADGNISGLIELRSWHYGNIPLLIELGLILPLDEYLADNPTYQSLPGYMRKAFVMPDGQTWALSTSSPLGIYSRKLKKEWLDNLKLSLPRDLNELYDISKQFAYEDPNGNDLQDEHGMDIITNMGARMLNDIFLANGCYLSRYATTSISYDYETEAYEDAVLKPGMLESLIYIKSLYDEKILTLNSSSDFMEKDTSGNFYSISINYDYRKIDINDWYEVHSFTDAPNSIIGNIPDKCFILTANTPNPKETINAFVNTFLSDIQGMAMSNFGLEGKNYTYKDKVLTNLYQPDGNILTNYSEENMNLTHYNFSMLLDQGVTVIDPELTDINIDGIMRETQLYTDFYNDGRLFIDPNYLLHKDFGKIDARFSSAFVSYLYNIDSISPQEFIDNYIKDAKTAGWQQILDDLNEKSGSTAHYNYD